LSGFVSEVGFVEKYDKNTFKLRYFSAEREVDFCGHATIAIMYDVINSDAKLLKQSQLTIVTNNNTLCVENRILNDDAVFISAPDPVFRDIELDLKHVASLLGIDSHQLDQNQSIEVINAGLTTLILPIKSLDAIISVSPDFSSLNDFCLAIDIDIIILFCAETHNQSNAYRTRVFTPTFGYLEDPATGAGNAAFAHYLLKNKLWQAGSMTIEQNGSVEHANIIKLVASKIDESNTQVAFGGSAIVRMSGQYFL